METRAKKAKNKNMSMEKREDVATDGDGVVTMRQDEKNKLWSINCLHVKGNMVVRLGKACIPLVNHW
jgi:hypothetical protein